MTLGEGYVTDEMHFNSHVLQRLTTTVRLVNALTPGGDRGRPVTPPTGQALRTVVADTVLGVGRDRSPSLTDARALRAVAGEARRVIMALDAGEADAAARLVNEMLGASDARPHLDPDGCGGQRLHFHGPDDSFVRGWAAGIAAALAMAIGSDLGSQLGICAAPGCDRAYLDMSRNSHRRFCSTQCQNRVKTAAYRARAAHHNSDR